MATTLGLPLPLNILEDFRIQQLKTSTSFHLKKILQRRHRTFEKNWRLRKRLLHIKKNWTWALFFVQVPASRPTLKTSDFSSNICKSKKMKTCRISPSALKTSRFLRMSRLKENNFSVIISSHGKRNFHLKTSLQKFCKKIRSLLTWRRSSKTTMRQKWRSEELKMQFSAEKKEATN